MDNQRFEQLLIKEWTGTLSEAERQELQEFLRVDPILRREYQLLLDYWTNKGEVEPDVSAAFGRVKDKIRILEEVPVEEEVFEEQEMGIAEAGRSLPGRRRLVWVWRSAAALVCLSLGVYGLYRALYPRKADTVEWQQKYAARRTRSNLVLSDGSSVLLNADSRLKFPISFDGHAREVFLDGEAFFDVRKDPDHPFIIHTGKMDIRVLGTAFNVKSYSNDVRVEATLIRGSIEVTFPDRPSDRIILKPKDKLVLGIPASKTNVPSGSSKEGRGEADEKYKLTELTYYRPHDSTVIETSWTENKLAFRHEAFGDLARRMERWYGVSILFDKQELADITFTGLFAKESIEEALKALQLSEKFQYTIKGTTIHIY